MILECPSCEKRYDLPVELPEAGRKVRCANCGHVWHATAEHVVTTLAAEPTFPEESEPENDIDFEDSEPEPEPVVEDQAVAAEPEDPPQEPDLAVTEPHEPEDPGVPDEPEDIEARDADPDDDGAEPEPQAERHEEDRAEADDAGEADPEDAEPGDEKDAQPEFQPPVEVPEHDTVPISIDRPQPRGLRTAAVAIGWTLLTVFTVGALSLAYWQPVEVVRLLPGAAKLYARLGVPVNVRGLQFEKVAFKWSVDAGRPTLEVHGDIVNVTAEPIKVPTVVFALRNAENVEVYQWAADVRSVPLDAKDRTRFVARIPTPPRSIRSVQLRFAKAR